VNGNDDAESGAEDENDPHRAREHYEAVGYVLHRIHQRQISLQMVGRASFVNLTALIWDLGIQDRT